MAEVFRMWHRRGSKRQQEAVSTPIIIKVSTPECIAARVSLYHLTFVLGLLMNAYSTLGTFVHVSITLLSVLFFFCLDL